MPVFIHVTADLNNLLFILHEQRISCGVKHSLTWKIIIASLWRYLQPGCRAYVMLAIFYKHLGIWQEDVAFPVAWCADHRCRWWCVHYAGALRPAEALGHHWCIHLAPYSTLGAPQPTISHLHTLIRLWAPRYLPITF